MSTLRVDTLQTTDGSFSIDVNQIGSGGGGTTDNARVYKVRQFDDLANLIPNAEGDTAIVAYRRGATGRHSELGGGKFVALTGSATADSGTIINSTGFYWKRIGFTEVTPQMFNATVDGVANDGPAIRAALAYAQTNGIPLYMPAGNYLMSTGTLTATTYGTVIEGDGIGRTNLYVSSTLTAFTVNPSVNNTVIRNMTIQSVGLTRTVGTRAVYANGGNLSTGSIGFLELQGLQIVGFYDAFNLQYCQLGKIRDCTCELNQNGYYSKLSINMRVYNNKFNNNYGRGIFLDGDSASVSFSAGTLCSNNEIVNNGVSASPQITVQYNEHFTLSNNMIDVPASTATHNVHVIGTARGTISSNWIGSSIQQGVRLENAQAVMVQGNNIVSCAAEGLVNLGSSTGNIINGNVFENNTSTDILLGGTGTGSVISNNVCASPTPTNSIAESSSSLSNLIVGNIYKKGFVSGASTTIANNKQV